MTAGEWPPRVWHGVIDPQTGDPIPPIRADGGVPDADGPDELTADDLPDGTTPAAAGEAFANGDDPTTMEDNETDETAAQDPDTDADVETLAESMQVLNQQLNGIRILLQQQNSIQREYVNAARDAAVVQGTAEEQQETDTSVESDHEYDADELEEIAYRYFQKAAGFYDSLFEDVVEVEFAEVDGQHGLKVESGEPWNTHCYDDGWEDEERWEKHNDAFKKTVDYDEIDWNGEPDYFYFIPAADVREVMG